MGRKIIRPTTAASMEVKSTTAAIISLISPTIGCNLGLKVSIKRSKILLMVSKISTAPISNKMTIISKDLRGKIKEKIKTIKPKITCNRKLCSVLNKTINPRTACDKLFINEETLTINYPGSLPCQLIFNFFKIFFC